MAPEGFRLKAFDLGLSKVEIEDPDTSEGVRIVGGAGIVIPKGVTEAARSSAKLCGVVVAGIGDVVELFLGGCASARDLLALLANLETC